MTIHLWVRDASAQENCHLDKKVTSSERSREPALSEVEGDLQFCRPVLEMFFDRVLMRVGVKVCRAYGARTMLGNRCPSPAGLADVWRSALRASKRRPLPRKNISRTSPQNCRSLGYAPSKNIPRKGPRNCRSLGCARDDKGEGRRFHGERLLD